MININPGKQFEKDFQAQVPKEIWLYRIKDPAQSFGQNNQTVRFSPKNEFDFLMFKSPTLYALELKSTKQTSFSFSLTDNKKMIKANQIKELTKLKDFEHTVSGIIFNFRTTEHTYFLSITDFNEFVSHTIKSSINEKDIISCNGLLLNQSKVRTRYKYDLEPLIKYEGGVKNG